MAVQVPLSHHADLNASTSRKWFHCILRCRTGIPRSLECYSSMVQNFKTYNDETPLHMLGYRREMGAWNLYSCCSSATQIYISI